MVVGGRDPARKPESSTPETKVVLLGSGRRENKDQRRSRDSPIPASTDSQQAPGAAVGLLLDDASSTGQFHRGFLVW